MMNSQSHSNYSSDAPDVVTPKADNEITDFMNGVMEAESREDFYFYEPWEPDENNRDDGSRGFQVAFLLDDFRVRCANAANRVGKTIMDAIEIVIMMTGEVPHSLRWPKGHVTDVVRPWEDEGSNSPGALNRIRWGFKDPDTGIWHPPKKHPDMPDPGWPMEAPCGWVVGCGVFPQKKISRRRRDAIWICTWKQVRDERWAKLLPALIPRRFLDTRHSPDGYSSKDNKFRLTNGNEITLISYEMGYKRIQGANVWAIYYDEEPDDRRFWTEGDQRLIDGGHDGWMVLSYTPLSGLSWSYNDLYLPILNRTMANAALYHATQYDSPYISLETINFRVKNNYKPWEIEARVHGRFSEMQGRPYYDWEKLSRWRKMFVPHYDLFSIIPNTASKDIWDLLELRSRFEQAYDENRQWEVYEKAPIKKMPYWIAGDTAEKSEDERSDRDKNVAMVFRPPMDNEHPDWPVLAAMLRTGIEPHNFGRELLYAAAFFNNALLVPETKGLTGGEVLGEIREWPFIYRMVVVDDYTNKPKKKLGFDMNGRTRQMVFDLTGDFINSFARPQPIKSLQLLNECHEMIVGRGGRPDHPVRGTSDCVVTFGMGQYVWKYSRDQLNDNSDYVPEGERRNVDVTPFSRYLDKSKSGKAAPLGSRNRNRTGNQRREPYVIT